MKPPCDYIIDGIASIWALDYGYFKLFRFEGDGLYDNCIITAIKRTDDFIEIASPETANYTSTLQNGIYNHTLETFIADLSGESISNLHLATKKRFIPIYKTHSGRYFCFGYEAGASFIYAAQTSEGLGSMVTMSASSVYPLFEVQIQDLEGPVKWILETGEWDDTGLWTTDGIWKTKNN